MFHDLVNNFAQGGLEPPRDCRRPVYLSYAAMGMLSIAA
jgi:hypothetical protein